MCYGDKTITYNYIKCDSIEINKKFGDHYTEIIQSMYSNSIRTSSFGVIYLIQSTITVIVSYSKHVVLFLELCVIVLHIDTGWHC